MALQGAMRSLLQLIQVFLQIWRLLKQTHTIAPIHDKANKNIRHRKPVSNQVIRGSQDLIQHLGGMYESLIILLRYLVSRYEIAPEFLLEPDRYESLDDIATKGGIVSHVNYRRAGKEDIGPAFDWERVIGGVRAANP